MLAASQTTRVLHGTSTAAVFAARVSGYHVAFLAAAIMLAAGVALLTFGLRPRDIREVELAIETSGTAPVPAG
jgi:hypothetical protein